MYDKLNHNQLEHISGGQYDHDAVYINTHAVRSGNLYNIHNIRETVGSIIAGQAVQLHHCITCCWGVLSIKQCSCLSGNTIFRLLKERNEGTPSGF